MLKLFDNFNDDPIAKKEINQVWQEAKKEAKGKNPNPDWVEEYINMDFSKETFEEDLDAPVVTETFEELA